MRPRYLLTRFVLAGCLLVMTTVGSGVWSAVTFARLSRTVDDALTESRELIDATADLANSLEREDDVLLLALSGDVDQARRKLAAERDKGDHCYDRIKAATGSSAEGKTSNPTALRAQMDLYRNAGTELIEEAGKPGARGHYHRQVNPLLRRAVAIAEQIRQEAFESLRQTGLRARDEASHATWVVTALSLGAVLLASSVSFWLARSVVRPVQALSECVEALRRGEFESRVPPKTNDELGQLAEGVNRLAQTLTEYRSSSLGELLTAKITLEAILNALPEAVVVVAPDGTLAMVNPPAEAVLTALQGGSERGRLEQLSLGVEHRKAIETALRGRPAAAARTDFGRALRVNLAGRTRQFFLTAVPVPEFAPHQSGAVIVLDDVTEFARLEELRGDLIGVASHELKTPLTTLRMNLLLLGETVGLTNTQREMLQAALSGCEELGETIDELLDMTRIEAGKLRLDQAPVDLVPILERAIRPLQMRFEDAGVNLRVVRPAGPLLARGDANRLRTVVTNLLTNALKYSHSSTTVTVQVMARQNSERGDRATLEIAVIDEGPGIPKEYRERVFEKFFRVEHQTDPGSGTNPSGVHGTGIGLYLCREIIKAHGGSVYCTTGPGGTGTRVAFTLPAHEPPV